MVLRWVAILPWTVAENRYSGPQRTAACLQNMRVSTEAYRGRMKMFSTACLFVFAGLHFCLRPNWEWEDTHNAG